MIQWEQLLYSPVSPNPKNLSGVTRLRFALALYLLLALTSASAQSVSPRARLLEPIDDSSLITLRGNTHPLARPQFDRGAAPYAQPARRMMLLLSRAPEQQKALDTFVGEQQDPSSPNYRHWLTPDQFAKTYGPAQSDIQQVTGWLQAHGFAINRVSAGNTVIEFSGTAGQVRAAFHTQLHKYSVNGRENWANSSDPQIPSALAKVVNGLVSLNNFPRKPLSRRLGAYTRTAEGKVLPQYTYPIQSTNFYAIGPADFATIYNTAPLLQAGINGAGQNIAIIGVTNVDLQDVTDFRNMFGLGAGNTSVVIDGPDPGIVDGYETESLIDLEWANAVAPSANVMLVSAADTETSSGLDLATTYILDHDLAGVISISYGDCELHLGNTGNQMAKALYEQASAQGITVVVSSGDNGSVACDNPNTEFVAHSGLAVSGMASTAYNVAVGGTDFDDAGLQSTYFNSTNDPVTRGSAKSYIPEIPWNESCAALATSTSFNVCPVLDTNNPAPSLNLWAGSGGPSSCVVSSSGVCQSGTPKPAWQTGTGVPADGVRDIPDVSLFSAASSRSHSFYVLCQKDQLPSYQQSCKPDLDSNMPFLAVGGTSVAAPAFGAIVALADQKTGTRLGNVNYLLYSLAAAPGASCASTAAPAASCVFNDVVKGNISVPCRAGSSKCSLTTGTGTGVMVNSSGAPAYAASASYDLATGLGSVNATNLVNAIAAKLNTFTATSTSLTLNGSSAALTANHGDTISVGVNVTPTSSVGDVSLLGPKGGIDSHPLAGGSVVWNSQLFPGGAYTVKAHFPGDGTHGASDSNGVSVNINPEASKTFANFLAFNNQVTSYTNTVAYGSPYILRLDVADTAATLTASPSNLSSKCSNNTASCPTGSITLTANGSPFEGGKINLNSSGYAEDWSIQLPGGTYNVTAAYTGDASYTASTATPVLTVTKAPTTFAVAMQDNGPYEYGSRIDFGGNLTTSSSGVAPTGAVTYTDNGSPADPNSVQQVFFNASPATSTADAGASYAGIFYPATLGSHTVTPHYSGDQNYAASDGVTASFNVTQATTYGLGGGISPNAVTAALPTTIQVQFSSGSRFTAPTGTITFYDNGTPVTGTQTYTSWAGTIYSKIVTTLSQSGANAITASYSGDTLYKASPTAQLGNVAVYDKLPTTVNNIDSNLTTALKNFQVTLKTSINIPNTSNLPLPTGTITFSDNGVVIPGTVTTTQLFTGYGSNTLQASIPYNFPSTGSHNITINYSGDSIYAPSVSTGAQVAVVDQFPTHLRAFQGQGSVNNSTTLTAAISGPIIYFGPVMTGTVTFLDNGVPLSGTPILSPNPGDLIAYLYYTFTTPGTHNITVQYSGDANYAPLTSAVQAVDIAGPIVFQLYNNRFTTNGGSGNTTGQIYNTTNSPLAVTFTCTSDSPAATCSVSPSSLTIGASSNNGVTVNFTVPALTGSTRHYDPFGTPFIFAGVLFGACFASRKKRALALTLLIAAFIFSMASCGGGGGSQSTNTGGGFGTTPSKTYNFTVTGTAGSYSQTQTFMVTVNKT